MMILGAMRIFAAASLLAGFVVGQLPMRHGCAREQVASPAEASGHSHSASQGNAPGHDEQQDGVCECIGPSCCSAVLAYLARADHAPEIGVAGDRHDAPRPKDRIPVSPPHTLPLAQAPPPV